MIEDLIRRARRRFLLNETLAQCAFAASVSVAGFVLMLIFGTRFLEWWTLSLFAIAGLALGGYRVYLNTPDEYATAVQVDANAHLHDALSTALHFSNSGAAAGEFRQPQREQAERAAGGVQIEQAVPFVVPRSLYIMAALCVLASALIGLRYGFGHTLDLRAPITQLIFEDEAVRDAKKAKSLYPKSGKWTDEAQSLLSKLGLEPKPNEPTPTEPDELEKAIDQALQNSGDPNGMKNDKGGTGQGGQPKAGANNGESPTGDPLDNGDKQNSAQEPKDGSEQKAGNQGSKSNQGKNGSQNTKETLLSRLKDAVSNLLSKNDKGDSPSSEKNQQNAKNDNQQGQKGQASKGQQQQGESQSDAEGQPDADAQNGQQAQGRLNNASSQTPTQGGSGIGNQDGSKELKEAAQLKAMGKISEIIGQRAATVSGETSVEVQSGNQKLQTDYSKTAAAHAETDGDVTRDEIPLALQPYVQQYFAQVHKAPEAAKAKAATPKQ